MIFGIPELSNNMKEQVIDPSSIHGSEDRQVEWFQSRPGPSIQVLQDQLQKFQASLRYFLGFLESFGCTKLKENKEEGSQGSKMRILGFYSCGRMPVRCTPHRRGARLLGTQTGLLSLFLKLIVAMPMLYLRSSGNKEHFHSFNFQAKNVIASIIASI